MSDIEITKDGQVAIVTLNRGPQRNAVTHAMWKELASIFAGFNANAEVRGVILTGAGGNFSVGADVSEFGKVRSDGAQSKAYEVAVDAASEAIANARMPVIAVLAGYCPAVVAIWQWLAVTFASPSATPQSEFRLRSSRSSYGVRARSG